MANKQFKLLDPQQAGTSGTSVPSLTDWEKCALCQQDTDEALSCPADSKRNTGCGYQTVADYLLTFSQSGCLPKSLDLSRLDDGDGIQSTFQTHKAKWHDSCRLKYNKTSLHRAQKRLASSDESTGVSRKYTRHSAHVEHTTEPDKCFFCDKPAETDSLRKASSFDLDKHVRTAALKLGDKALLAKLSAGDLIAQDAQYHVKCLVSLYNKARNTKKTLDEQDDINHGIALGELVSYIDDARMNSLVTPVFKLIDLTRLYTTRLEQLGTVLTVRVHSTKLKDRIMTYFPDLEEHMSGRDILLAFNHDVGSALEKACAHDTDSDGVCLARAANIVRRDMMKIKTTFCGSFETHCQEQSVPNSLVSLVSMILNGPNIQEQSSHSSISIPDLTISQLLMFNSYTRRRENTSTTKSTRHSHNRETPLPVYLGMLIHTKTRKRELVDALFNLGLSISYDRVLSISTDLGNRICRFFLNEGTVCPPKLKRELFTTGAVDNIDHNPSSTSAQDSFHGTSISLFQHPNSDSQGVQRVVPDDKSTCAAQLPQSYTIIPPVVLGNFETPIPKLAESNKSNCQLIPQAMQTEYRWLEQMEKTLMSDTPIQEEDMVSWAGYHASMSQPTPVHPEPTVALTSFLPLFHDQAKSVAMIRHSMDVIKRAVDILNPGQIPVITLDQPLFTLAKQIQWRWPETYGEDHYVIMFGGLHIEMAAWKTLGDLLDSSGWTGALVLAGVATSGSADSFLKVAHVTRTRRAHQVTASTLYLLLKEAYRQYTIGLDDGQDPIPLDDWCAAQAVTSPQFQFWILILQLELAVLIYVRSIREGNFLLYIDSLSKLVSWFFALGHTNYARWIPVHLRDMVTLETKHPNVYAQFQAGNFTVKKTTNTFSAIALDQAHEQHNALVKGDGGAVGLTENPAALHCWMVSGPEMARLISEFEETTGKEMTKTEIKHHEQKKHVQEAFVKDVRGLTNTIRELGNPFNEDSKDLLVLDSRDLADPAVIETLYQIEKLGQEQYESYVAERLVHQTKPITDPIKRNNLPLFSRPPVREKSKSELQVLSLKSDCSLFSRLFIASQTRGGDLDEFFAHENQTCPPALSHMGNIRLGTKSDLLGCLEEPITPRESDTCSPHVEVMILDGAAIVNMLAPGNVDIL